MGQIVKSIERAGERAASAGRPVVLDPSQATSMVEETTAIINCFKGPILGMVGYYAKLPNFIKSVEGLWNNAATNDKARFEKFFGILADTIDLVMGIATIDESCFQIDCTSEKTFLGQIPKERQEVFGFLSGLAQVMAMSSAGMGAAVNCKGQTGGSEAPLHPGWVAPYDWAGAVYAIADWYYASN